MDPLRFLQLSNDDQATMGQLERIYDGIIASKRVIVISGAGISCSSGLQVSHSCCELGCSDELE
jgi:hypothetical protein